MTRSLPTSVKFLLADNIRQEVGGKLTVMGLYTGDELVIEDALPAELPKEADGIALQGLTILIVVMDAFGEFDITLQIYDPTGQQMGQGTPMTVNFPKGAAHNIIMPLTPFPVPAFGSYRLEVNVGGRKFEYQFIVRHRDPSARLPSPEAELLSAPRKPGSKKTETVTGAPIEKRGRASSKAKPAKAGS